MVITDPESTRTKLTPRIVNTFFILAIQSYFRDHPEFTFTGHDYDTKIDITTGYSEDGKSTAGSPIMTIDNGPVSIQPSGITTGINSGKFRDFANGIEGKNMAMLDTKHDFLVHGITNISLYGFSRDAMDELAFETAMFIMMLKYNVGQVLQIQNIDTCSVSPAQQIEVQGWTSKWVAQISFPYTFSVSMLYKPIDTGVLLRAIQTTIHNANGDVPYDEGIYAEFEAALKTGDTQLFNVNKGSRGSSNDAE